MKKFLLVSLINLLMLTFAFGHAQSTDKSCPVVYTIDIKKEIDNTTRIYLSKGLAEANRLHADAVLIHMNTYGGLVDSADSMRTAILYSPIPVYVFIDNNAASAGALISIACEKIFMREGANIGAATVVNQTGQAMPDKYQSYMRSMIRSTAEAHGKDTIIQDGDTIYKWKRDPLIAEAMVDERVVIPNLIDTGKVLTFTASEAIEWGYCDGIAKNVDDVVSRYLGYKDYELKSYAPSWLDNLKGFLMNPVLQSFLILLIIGGIYFEMQTPGFGFPAAISIIGAILYFAPLYIDGFAQYWEILIFLIGIVLIALEVFVIPGFGVAGIGGIILTIAGLVLSLVNNTDLTLNGIDGAELGKAILIVLIGIIAGFGLTVWLSSRIGESRGFFRKVALIANIDSSVSFSSISSLVGKEGAAATVLRPSGKVMIDGEYYDAVSESGFIEKGQTVRVIRVENSHVYVEN